MAAIWIALASAVALATCFVVGMTAWIGEPDRHIDFYEDSAIVCWWDNIDGLAWCAAAATGEERCSWHVDTWDASMGREDIPSRCWPFGVEA